MMHHECYYRLLGLTPHEDARHRWTLPPVGTPARQRIQRAAAAVGTQVPTLGPLLVATRETRDEQRIEEQPYAHDVRDGYGGGSPDVRVRLAPCGACAFS
jgi:hypothetical protein